MKFACHLKQHEERSMEHIQQAAALRIAQASELHDGDTEAMVMLEDDTVSTGPSE
jgi:hypothetical protein